MYQCYFKKHVKYFEKAEQIGTGYENKQRKHNNITIYGDFISQSKITVH